MSFHNDYLAIVSRVYDDFITLKPQTQEPSVPSSDWFNLTNEHFDLGVEQFLRVMNDLEKIGAITICNVMDLPDGDAERGIYFNEYGQPHMTNRHQDVSYVVKDFTVLQNKLIDLNESEVENKELLEIIEANEKDKKVVGEAGSLIAYANGAVYAGSDHAGFPTYLEGILHALIRNHKNLTTYDEIDTVMEKSATDNKRLRGQYISEVRRLLKEKYGVVKPIMSVRNRGWILNMDS